MKQFDVSKLPSDKPFLLLDWKKSRSKRYDFTCFYFFCFPVDRLDIRAKKIGDGHFCRTLISKTFTGGGSCQIRVGKIGMPFRDGAHIRWDSQRLGLAAYVRLDDKIQHIVFDENELGK